MSIAWVILNLVTWILGTIAYVMTETWEVFIAAGIVSVIHTLWSVWCEDDKFAHTATWSVANLGVWVTITIAVLMTEQPIMYTAAVIATAIFGAGALMNRGIES